MLLKCSALLLYVVLSFFPCPVLLASSRTHALPMQLFNTASITPSGDSFRTDAVDNSQDRQGKGRERERLVQQKREEVAKVEDYKQKQQIIVAKRQALKDKEVCIATLRMAGWASLYANCKACLRNGELDYARMRSQKRFRPMLRQ